MHVEFRITEREYRNAAMLALRKRSSLSSLDYYLPYIFTVVWISVLVFPALYHPDIELDLLLTLGVIPVFLGFLLLRRKNMRSDYEKLKNFHLHQALDLDATGLRLITTAGISRSSWDLYEKFAEDKTSFVLYLKADQTFLPIPKVHLTDAQADELRALLKSRMPCQ